MIHIETGLDLPRPGPDRLVLYLLGPGFGESQVVAFPDGRWMVVDGCVRGGINMPLSLLMHLGCTKVDLVAITHPDLDHIRGVPEVIERFSPDRVWSFPSARSLRNLLIRWTESSDSARRRLVDLRALHFKLKALIKAKNSVREVCVSARSWPPGNQAYRVDCIAPTDASQARLDELLDELIQVRNGQVEIRKKFEDQLLGRCPPGDKPNLLSLALSVSWNDRRFLLAGDVENGDATSFSGWRGVLDCLRQDELLSLVTGLDLVKVAHHGSKHALDPDSWALHAEGRKGSMVAVLTPFSRGGSPPPHGEALAALRDHVSYLGITANARGAFGRAEQVGWKRAGNLPPHKKTTGPVLTAVFEREGSLRLHASDMAALFQQAPRPTSYDHLLQDEL